MQRTIRSFIYGCTMFGVLGYLPSLGAAEPSTNKASTPVKIHKQGSLIDNLNLRYNDKVANCGGNTSALNCSGIILRRAKLEDGVEFWKLKEAATVLDSVTFSWLRADGASDSNDLSSGFIYMDQSTARASKYELPSPRCIYPFMAGTQNAKRMLKGCGPSDTPISEQPGKSYCITKGVDDLDSWLKDFEESKANVVKQCSLSVDGLPHQLIISLQVRKKYSELAKRYGNELLIPLWKEDKVNQLPIEAFFFKTADSGAFDFTLKLRESFYNKTGRMVPLVGLQFSTKDTHVFKPLTRDQQGRATANALNLRYAKTDPNCNDKAAVYCNGVLVRAVEFETTARAWNPS
ncbi:TPA: hypothetical protein ACKP22_004187, partial [Pseudomonas putida]